MRLPLLAALACLAAAPAAMAQTEPPVPVAASVHGVEIPAAITWLKGVGATVSEPETTGGRSFVTVNDGALTWTLWFYGCDAGRCDDLQYGAIFSNAQVTPERINLWNRDNRFLKAFYLPAEGETPARAVVQYDLLLTGEGIEQINDPTAIWADMLNRFALHIGYFQPQPDTGPAPTQPTPQ